MICSDGRERALPRWDERHRFRAGQEQECQEYQVFCSEASIVGVMGVRELHIG